VDVFNGGTTGLALEACCYGTEAGTDVSASTTFSADPRFVNPTAGVFLLKTSPLSPCIDAGDDDLTENDFADLDEDDDTGEDLPFDLRGSGRTYDHPSASGSAADMGA